MLSTKPFPETLDSLMAMQEVSHRELSRRTKRLDGWGAPGTINALVRGELRPTLSAMESVARALQVNPAVFAEYRLAKGRQELDPDVVGMASALKALERFENS